MKLNLHGLTLINGEAGMMDLPSDRQWPVSDIIFALQVDAAWKAAEGGVTTVIASGKGGDCILQALAGVLLVPLIFSRLLS